MQGPKINRNTNLTYHLPQFQRWPHICQDVTVAKSHRAKWNVAPEISFGCYCIHLFWLVPVRPMQENCKVQATIDAAAKKHTDYFVNITVIHTTQINLQHCTYTFIFIHNLHTLIVSSWVKLILASNMLWKCIRSWRVGRLE